MSGLIIPQRRIWTRQPQFLVGIDWANPICRGLIHACVPGVLLSDWKDGSSFSRYGSPGISAGAAGRTMQFNGSSQGIYGSRTDAFTWTSETTLFGVASQASTSAAGCILAYVDPTVDDEYRQIAFRSGGCVAAVDRLASSFYDTAKTAAGSVVANKFYAVAGVFRSATSRTIYLNGTAGATGTETIYNYPTSRIFSAGYLKRASLADYLNGQIAITLAWDRALSEREIKSISENPWQIFSRRDRYVSINIDSGGTIYTISPTGSISLLGSVTQLHERSLTPTGSLALTGTNLITFTNGATTYTIIPSGSVTLSGTNETNRYHLLVPQGNITLSGNAMELRTRSVLPVGSVEFSGNANTAEVKVFSPSGLVTFNGTAQLYMPGMEIESTKLPLTGVGS